MHTPRKKAFTLIEVLLVIVIIAILSSIVVVAINPARQIQKANDGQRSSDITAIMDAIYQYAIDNGGDIPSGITTTNGTIADIGRDICSDLVPTYIASMPFDPFSLTAQYTDCTDYTTDYMVYQDAVTGRITMTAPNAQQSTISVSM
jgi:prepilin-type N-terminal cleavage/methylation domain-containing protein